MPAQVPTPRYKYRFYFNPSTLAGVVSGNLLAIPLSHFLFGTPLIIALALPPAVTIIPGLLMSIERELEKE